ncbi:hypothetical protein [Agromyces sp. H66]|uniref:hypothetical protein n=1 Tax=Agromyces sp. H66 TaxID=2529859 RepID=UPI0010AA0D9A|nr:hypothetical protein [Agromyces sp. H66]
MIDPRNADMSPDRTRRLPRGDRFAIDLLLAVAALVVAFAVWSIWLSLSQKLTDGLYLFTLPLAGNPREITFPQPPDGTIVDARQTNEVTVFLEDVPERLSSLVLLHHLVSLGILLVIVGAFVTVLLRLRSGKPFVRSTTIVLAVTAVLLVIVGTGAEVLANVVDGVATEVITGGRHDTPLGTAWGWSISGIWILVGLALAVVVAVFAIGNRLERERERLQRDVTGLV